MELGTYRKHDQGAQTKPNQTLKRSKEFLENSDRLGRIKVVITMAALVFWVLSSTVQREICQLSLLKHKKYS
jgi:hypothetical protein